MSATPLPLFPNYTQMRQPLSLKAWQMLRIGGVACALALIVLLFVKPDAGLWLFWGIAVPVLPALFFVAPGVWRNVCPMATLNQTPRVFRFTRGLTLPRWLREHGYLIGIAIFLAVVPTRKVIFNDNGPALALLLIAVLAVAYLGGMVFKGKSGWCSSGMCPLFPVQRVYGQTPFAVVPNSHCQPCVGCAKNCYDFNPNVAYIADMNDQDRHYSGYRKLFVGAFPGLVLGFYRVPNPPAISELEMYGRFAVYVLASVALFFTLETLLRVSAVKLTTLFGAAALNIYYWYTGDILAEKVGEIAGTGTPDAVSWAIRGVVAALTVVWVVRTYRKERAFVAQATAQQRPSVVLSGSVMRLRTAGLGRPEVTFMPDQRRVVVEKGRTILEIAEKNDLRIESGCRMGVCGADPIAIVKGMENVSAVTDEERNTLERLGLATNTRMACVCRVQGDVSVALKPERPKAFSSSVIMGSRPDAGIKKVVVIGNGIAGVTAADHVRRRHPTCEIHLIARENHHLYNRMAIERLIYGRSAMQGLYLQEDQWYEDLQIQTWLNTRAVRIDREAKEVVLGMGDRLPYDRLILAMGSSSMVPPIEGYGMPGTFALREADDAFAIRSFAQEHGCRHALIAGGGLLGLEAAHALHKLGLHVGVMERSPWLLRRQLDQRGGQLLQEYLEGLGIEIITEAETASVSGRGRVQQVMLKDGRLLQCDLFLVAAGITPNVQLAQDAGLETNRGVLVNDHMQTSDPAIFAAGDIAEHRGTVYGLWPTAAEQAQVAAANAVTTGAKAYEGSVPATMLKVVGVDLMSIGRFEAQAGDTVIALEDEAEHRYRKLVIADGVVAGAILFGYPLLSPGVTSALKKHADVTPILNDLRAGSWDALTSLPEGAARPQPVAAQAGTPRPPAAPVGGTVPAAWAAAPPPPAQPTPVPPAAARPAAGPPPAPAPAPAAPAQPIRQPEPVRAEPPPQPVRAEAPPAGGAGAPPAEPARRLTPRTERATPQRQPARLVLQAEAGPANGRTWEVTEAGAIIGRAPELAVHIPDAGLSRQQARIDYRDGGWWLTDLGSTNGTYIHQTRLSEPHRLQSGDLIRAGATRIAVKMMDNAGGST
jgi:nitrite reductase (NADH) large subunit